MIVNALGYALALVLLIVAAGSTAGDSARDLRRPHPVAVGIWLVVAVPSVIGLVWQPVYDALNRDPGQIRAHGQVWRLLTSVVVQDGGIVGTCFNLVYLAVAAVLATAMWGPGRSALLFCVGAVWFNVLGTYVWPASGGGNSGATFFLAASTVALLALHARTRVTLACAAGVLLISTGLVWLDDPHGAALLGGLAFGLVVALLPGSARRIRRWQGRAGPGTGADDGPGAA